MAPTRGALARRGKRLLVRFRFKRQGPIRWATDVDQVTAPKMEDARAYVIKVMVQQSHHLLDWFAEWPLAFESTDATLHSLLVARGWRTER